MLENQALFSTQASGTGARQASEWLERICAEKDIAPEQLFRLDSCLTEVLANIIDHGGEGALAAPVELALHTERTADVERVVLSISDAGQPFDPLAYAIKPQATTLEEATPGGLGLTMIHQFSDRLIYAYRDGRNHLTVCVEAPAIR